MTRKPGSGTNASQAGDARRTVSNAVERAASLHRASPGQRVLIPRLTVRVPHGAGEATIAAAISKAMAIHPRTDQTQRNSAPAGHGDGGQKDRSS
jgi:hypothetical protein